MSFDDAGVPGQGQSGGDGVAVSVDVGRESVEAGQVVLADGVEPLRESSALALGEHLGAGPDVTSQGAEFRAVGQDGLEPELFDLGQRLGSTENAAPAAVLQTSMRIASSLTPSDSTDTTEMDGSSSRPAPVMSMAARRVRWDSTRRFGGLFRSSGLWAQ